MNQTLFVIEHWLFQGPLLAAWLILGLGIFGYLAITKGFRGETLSFIPIYVIVAVVIQFLLPFFEVEDLDRNPMGLAVRGYGFFLLIAIAVGLLVAWIRCRQIDYDFEIVLSLSFWMILCGIIGARIFFVVQKGEEEFGSRAPADWPLLLLNVTEGGLVVYGAVIGGLFAFLGLVFYRKLPMFKIADIIAPGMVIGLAIGRIGCLMNGCCFGGACDIEPISIHFPPGSPPYMRQLETGELFGMKTRVVKVNGPGILDDREVISVDENSIAFKKGIRKGDQISIVSENSDLIRQIKNNKAGDKIGRVTIAHPKLGNFDISVRDLPDRALGIHPTQIYSSINAGLLFLFLWFYYPYRKGEGEVFAWMLILYAITRFLLEAIRVDEAGIWGTPFSISQIISFGALVLGVAMLMLVRNKFPVLAANKTADPATIK